MHTKISKTLEGAIARTLFDTSKASITHSLKDSLFVELLRERGSLAYQIVATKLTAAQIDDLTESIGRSITESAATDNTKVASADFFTRYADHLRRMNPEARNISTAHALTDIIADHATYSAKALLERGVTLEMIQSEVERFSAGEPSERRRDLSLAEISRADSLPRPMLLEKFALNLTQLAREGRIDPVAGRDAEIERVIQILSRRKKNNPILIGEAGVGKSAIVEALALRMVQGSVPTALMSRELYSLELSSLVAGTKFRGEFEERMQQLVDELRESRRVILFIDEIHTIVGAGATQGALDAANILKPALARGELQTIGATTLDEYREHIEHDAALTRRFQRIVVEPTTESQTLDILRRIAPRYEQHHRVRYADEALRECVTLAGRYITDRHFPDKAIDLMDEAASRLHLHSAVEPDELKTLRQALRESVTKRQRAADECEYNVAAAARIEEIALRAKIQEVQTSWHESLAAYPAEVGVEHVEQAVTAMTGIPSERIAGGELERLRRMREYLSERVVGQNRAIDTLSEAVRRSRVGLRDANRPIGVFLFVGPTGVGKTLLAKELSQWLFGDGRGLVRLDMSEYSERHSVARLIGSPPGYVGYGEGGQLTEAVRRRPYSVILLDEIEKAHSEIFNTLLQLFDEGHLTDGAGRRVDFRNTIIIMTSNRGSRSGNSSMRRVGFRGASSDEGRVESSGEYRREIEQMFSAELLSRIDEIVTFSELRIDEIEQIARIEFRIVADRVAKVGYTISASDDFFRHLAHRGYESRHGVRSLRRALSEHVEQPLSSLIIDGKLSHGEAVEVVVNGDEIMLQTAS